MMPNWAEPNHQSYFRSFDINKCKKVIENLSMKDLEMVSQPPPMNQKNDLTMSRPDFEDTAKKSFYRSSPTAISPKNDLTMSQPKILETGIGSTWLLKRSSKENMQKAVVNDKYLSKNETAGEVKARVTPAVDIGILRYEEEVRIDSRKPVTDPRIKGGAFQAQSRVGADFDPE